MRLDILKLLLAKDLSDVNQLNSLNENCLHVAISSGFVEAAMMIITHLQECGDKEPNKEPGRKKSVPKKKKDDGMSIRIKAILQRQITINLILFFTMIFFQILD